MEDNYNFNKNILIDCDDVLVNFRDPALAAVQKETGKDHIHYSTFTDFDGYVRDFRITPEVFQKYLVKHKVLENCTLEPGAKELIESIQRTGSQVTLCTARGWYEKGEEVTLDFFKQQGIEFDDSIFVGYRESKFDAALKFSKATGKRFYMFVDDALHHHHLFSFPHCLNVLIARPWNLIGRQTLSGNADVVVCSDLYEVKRLYEHAEQTHRTNVFIDNVLDRL